MKNYFSEDYLDALLAHAGLNPVETETLISLAQGAHTEESLFASRLYESVEEVRAGLQGLLRKGLIQQNGASRNGSYALTEWKRVSSYFSSTPGGSNILKKIRALFHHPETDMYGMNVNPALKNGVPHVRNRHDFRFLYAQHSALLPKVEIKAMSKCNLNCIYCYYQNDFDTPPNENLQLEIRKAKELGMKNATLIGGEFTIRKDNLKILDAVSDAGFEDIELFTNGLMFYNGETLKAFVDRGMTSVFLHVSAVEEKTYERLARTKGTYAVLLEALKNMERFPDISLTVFTVVNKINLKQLKDIAVFFREFNRRVKFKNFFHYFGFYCVYSTDSNAWENRKKLVPKMTEAAPYIQHALDAVKNGAPSALYGRIPFCLMKGYEAYNFDLYSTMAKFVSGPEKQKGSNRSFTESIFMKTPSCRECIHDKYCVGIMKGYAKIHGLDEFRPVKEKP